MIMSQILDKEKIPNHIISFPNHVIVSVDHNDGSTFSYDPDYGVTLAISPDKIVASPQKAAQFYEKNGYSQNEVETIRKIYAKPFQQWNGVTHFVTRRNYFEQFAYALKWPLPILMLISALMLLTQKRNTK